MDEIDKSVEVEGHTPERDLAVAESGLNADGTSDISPGSITTSGVVGPGPAPIELPELPEPELEPEEDELPDPDDEDEDEDEDDD